MGASGLLQGSRFAFRVSALSRTFESLLTILIRGDVHRSSPDLERPGASPQSTAMFLHTSLTLSLEHHLMTSYLRGYEKYDGF